MNELIAIKEEKSQQLVDARDLYKGLQVKSKFADWIKNQIQRARLTENIHFETFSKNLENGGRQLNYLLTLDAAKHISMMQGDDIGFKFRDYFISAEKKLKQVASTYKMPTKKEIALLLLESENEKEQLEIENQRKAQVIENQKIELKENEHAVSYLKNAAEISKKSLHLRNFAKIHSFIYPDGSPVELKGNKGIYNLLQGKVKGFEKLKCLELSGLAESHYVKNGWLEIKYHRNGYEPTTMITEKGQQALYKKFAQYGIHSERVYEVYKAQEAYQPSLGLVVTGSLNHL